MVGARVAEVAELVTAEQMLELAATIDARRAEIAARLASEHAPHGSYAHGAAVLLSAAYPALGPRVEREPHRLGEPSPLLRGALEATAAQLEGGPNFRRDLRRFAEACRWQIALREVLPPELGGAPIEETAAELSLLADVTIEAALQEAIDSVFDRLGAPRNAVGDVGALVVLGMGKLGGNELNCGSDVDLMCFYDSDEDPETASDPSGHTIWTKVVQRMTESLEEVTPDGFVWRVDHRLRPEGARGPLVNSLAAAERYYETFGRLWERAALVRARPVAGDLELGRRLLHSLEPFVWTRRVDPSIAERMFALVHRARAEQSMASQRDLKLGPGGIREAEFFVQSLQLIWGGRHPQLRVQRTIEATERLLTAGLVTHREAEELTEAYVALRQAEHATQWASGVQTHNLPSAPEDLGRLARAMGYVDDAGLTAALEEHGARVGALLASLLPEGVAASPWGDALIALDHADAEDFAKALAAAGMPDVGDRYDGQLERDLFELARFHPDGFLGARTRERMRGLVDTMLDAVAQAADPTQAARYLRGFASRIWPPAVYTKLLADDPASVRRLCSVLGASAFVGEAVAQRPELADLVLFSHGPITPRDARDEVRESARRPAADGADPFDHRVGQLRKAQRRITTQVALADLAGELDTREATRVLSALADATLDAATRWSLGVTDGEPVRGLAILAMGKLGGSEIGYGSDLDVIFLFDPTGQEDPVRHFSKAARKIIQLISMPHVEGRGYELDTRLRPSGSQGMLVVSLDAFATYHGVATHSVRASGQRAATWERLALLRARFAAGDEMLGREAERIAGEAAYRASEEPEALSRHVHHLRRRMEDELACERPGRYDLKLGRGGLVDIEFAVQLLQLRHGGDATVRSTRTWEAIEALASIGALGSRHATALSEGYDFLRRLEQRMRVLHGDSKHLLEERAAGMVPLARRMGIRGPQPAAELMTQYRAVTDRVRSAYEAIVAPANTGI
jgi:[glutamine synthetase] adenylyltransferase / [glutamine synthetase]-adenylyl-L-tyrosine phosphorylase